MHNPEDLKVEINGKEEKHPNQEYWLKSIHIIPLITYTLSILLLKILYSKINLNNDAFNRVISRLLIKYFDIKENRERFIKNIKNIN